MKKKSKIVVTGLGVVSRLGSDVETFWSALCSGATGYSRDPELEAKNLPFRVSGKLPTIPGDWSAQDSGRYDRATRLALSSTNQAIRDARLFEAGPASTIAVVMGTTCGANDVIEEGEFDSAWFGGHQEKCPPESFRKYNHGNIANAVSRRNGFSGPSYVVGTACSSGNHAIGEAIHLLESGSADAVICGGADAFTLLPTFGFYSMNSHAAENCRPFERNRDGLILSEGSAALVLEREEHSQARGARARARVGYWSANCDAVSFAAPLASGERCESLIRQCLCDAGLAPGDIDYVNVHGTGTKANDLMEAKGIIRVWGSASRSLPISSIKGALGHSLGAAGAFEGVAATLALETGRIPPNSRISDLDEGVDLDMVTQTRPKHLRTVLSLSFAFGGCNIATLFTSVNHEMLNGN